MVTPSSTPTDAGSHGSCCTNRGGTFCAIVRILIIVGGLNWGLVGLGGFLGSDLNVVHILLGSIPAAENLVYLLVGVATLTKLLRGKKCHK